MMTIYCFWQEQPSRTGGHLYRLPIKKLVSILCIKLHYLPWAVWLGGVIKCNPNIRIAAQNDNPCNFSLAETYFKIAQKVANICPTFINKFVLKNFQKSPNLVTLAIGKSYKQLCDVGPAVFVLVEIVVKIINTHEQFLPLINHHSIPGNVTPWNVKQK